MNRKNLLGIVMILLIISSGPVYLPLVFALTNTSQTIINETYDETGTISTNELTPNNTITAQTLLKQPMVSLAVDKQEGASPLPVKLTCQVKEPETAGGIQIYKWDFDGDGIPDRATQSQNTVVHIFETKRPKQFNSTVTVGFYDGSYKTAKTEIQVKPVNQHIWHEIKEIGSNTKIGVMKNGTIVVYDESSWLPITFTEGETKLTQNSYSGIDSSTRRLSYPLQDGRFNVTITYGIMGKAFLKFEELSPEGILKPSIERTVELPDEKKTTNLKFQLITQNSATPQNNEDTPVINDNLDHFLPKSFTYSTLPLIYSQENKARLWLTGDDPVFGEIGANHNPWYDQGITPYGEYFEDNQEFISMHTGFLTIIADDLSIPGRGLDLVVNRVYAPPIVYEDGEPASAPDYSYQDYPWAPMGNGWMLGYPWIELDDSNPAYIRFSGGQRYEWNGSSMEGKEYHSGDMFTLVGHANGNYTLYTVDGTRYDYDSDYKPKRISDQDGNEIVFHYTGNLISIITDTIGRNVTLSYNENNLLSNVTSGSRVISYNYDECSQGYQLVNVTDPVGRVTSYEYFTDYLVDKVIYPTGGSTWYTYSVFEDSSYSKYRVSGQSKYPLAVPANSTYIELDNVKNIQVLDEPFEYGYVHAFDFEGDEKYTNSSYIWLWWRWYYGYIHLWKGYIEWQTDSIPDDADVTELNYYYDCYALTDKDRPGSIKQMEYRSSLSNASILFDDISDGSNYVGVGDFPLLGEYKEIDLNSNAMTDMENNLDEDWFAIGLSWTTGQGGEYPDGDGTIDNCQFDTGSSANPRGILQVIYDDPVETQYVEGASYVSYNFDSTFSTINNTLIKHSDGLQTTRTTRIDYKQTGFTEKVWNGTTSDSVLYQKNTDIDDEKTRRRILVEYYPGESTTSVNKTMGYDNWGNNYYLEDYENHKSYYSYANTNSMNQFNDTSGTIETFSDSFPTNNIQEYIHNRLVGEARLQNSTGSSALESYYTYDEYGNLIEIKKLLDEEWIQTSYNYDTFGHPVKRIDPEGSSVFYEYNSTYQYAYPTKYIQQLEQDSGDLNLTKHYGYNSVTGDLLYSVDELGERTDYSYDEAGRILTITYPVIDGVRCVESAEYNDSGNYIELTDENGAKTIKHYDGLGRTTLVERLNGSEVYSNESYAYNWQGNIAAYVQANGYNTTYHYDALGKLIKTVNPDGSETKTKYDYANNNVTVIDEEGRKKVLYYDWLDRLVQVDEYNDSNTCYTTKYRYDAIGNLRNITDALDHETGYVYDQFNRLTRVDYPDSSLETYVYDDLGNLIEKQGLDGEYLYYDYDSLNRQTSVSNSTAPFSINYKYDHGGNLIQAIQILENSSLPDFSDTFESGDLSNWDGYVLRDENNELDATTNNPLAGDYSLEAYTNGDLHDFTFVYDQGYSYDDFYAEFMLYVDDHNITSDGDRIYFLFGTDDIGNEIITLGWNKYNGDLRWVLGVRGAVNYYGSSTPSLDTWYHVSVFWHRGDSDGWFRIYVNDVEEIGQSGIDTDRGTPVESIKLGLPYSGPQVSSRIYIDDFNMNEDMMSFKDGFDSDGLSSWDYSVLRDENNELEASMDNPKSGNYSLLAYTNGDLHDFTFVYDQGYSYDDLYAEFMLYVDDHNITSEGDRIYFLFGTDIVGNEIITLGWKQVSGGLRWVFGVRGAVDYYGSSTPELDTWYNVRVYWHRGDSGNFTISVDGFSEISETGVDTDRGTPIELVKLGLPYSGPRVSAKVYIDEFLMHSEMDSVVSAYRYDVRGRLVEEGLLMSDGLYEVTYSYDNASNIVGMNYPDGSELFLGYDFANRLTAVGDYATLSYTLIDGISTINYGNGVTTEYSYDSRNRPVNIETINGASMLLNLTYTYDKTGSVTSINNSTHTEYYMYDLLDRLNSTTGPWGTIDYAYDPVGNRLSKVVQGGSTITYAYDNMYRITSATGLGFDWDTNGNMVYKHDGIDAWNYTFDPLNRLTKVQKNGVLSAWCTYDAGGRRVRSWDTVDGVTDYVYSGLNIIDEIQGSTHEKHVYAGGMHIASNTTGVVEYYHVDHLGSTRLRTNSTGGVIYESNYEPFGPGVGESGSEDYRYTGKYEDPSGLYYFGARYYDPDVGRFITRDTVFGDLTDPQIQNRYVYCMNNPHKYVDPDGRIALQVGVSGNVGLGLGITGGAGTAFVLGRNGLETGTYSESGLGLFIGEALSGGGEFTITPFAMSLEDLEGTSINLGAKAAFGVQLGGLSISVGQNEDGSIDLWGLSVTVAIPGAGAGLEAAGTITWTETIINEDENLLPDNNDILMYCETSDTKSTMTGWDEYDKHRGV